MKNETRYGYRYFNPIQQPKMIRFTEEVGSWYVTIFSLVTVSLIVLNLFN